ncbi:MAG: hypothetical protein FJ225_12945, partial [Lentisphaerae bacterium]|nr:hypothetical protein [Lentisphaerota bacterium]
MTQTDRIARTKRVLTTVATAALWLAGAGGGFAAEPPTGPTYTNSLGMGFVRLNAGAFVMGQGTSLNAPDSDKAGANLTTSLDWDEQP